MYHLLTQLPFGLDVVHFGRWLVSCPKDPNTNTMKTQGFSVGNRYSWLE